MEFIIAKHTMLLKVLLNPVPMTPGISAIGIPATSANSKDTAMMDKKGWIFNLAIEKIMRPIAITKAIIRGIPDIPQTSFLKYC